jgi:hypothetical protein
VNLHALIGQFSQFSFVSRILKGAAGSLLGVALLGWVVVHSGPRSHEVVVHVAEPDVEVTVGDRTYQIEGRRYDPIVCELSSGWHRLVMGRGDRILFEETFEVRPGMNVVRVAYDPERFSRIAPTWCEGREMKTQPLRNR